MTIFYLRCSGQDSQTYNNYGQPEQQINGYSRSNISQNPQNTNFQQPIQQQPIQQQPIANTANSQPSHQNQQGNFLQTAPQNFSQPPQYNQAQVGNFSQPQNFPPQSNQPAVGNFIQTGSQNFSQSQSQSGNFSQPPQGNLRNGFQQSNPVIQQSTQNSSTQDNRFSQSNSFTQGAPLDPTTTNIVPEYFPLSNLDTKSLSAAPLPEYYAKINTNCFRLTEGLMGNKSPFLEILQIPIVPILPSDFPMNEELLQLQKQMESIFENLNKLTEFLNAEARKNSLGNKITKHDDTFKNLMTQYLDLSSQALIICNRIHSILAIHFHASQQQGPLGYLCSFLLELLKTYKNKGDPTNCMKMLQVIYTWFPNNKTDPKKMTVSMYHLLESYIFPNFKCSVGLLKAAIYADAARNIYFALLTTIGTILNMKEGKEKEMLNQAGTFGEIIGDIFRKRCLLSFGVNL